MGRVNVTPLRASQMAREAIEIAPDLDKFGGCKTCRYVSFERVPPDRRNEMALDLYRIVIDASDNPEDLCNLAHLMGAILAGDGYDAWCPAHDPCLDLAGLMRDYREGKTL